MKTVKVGPIKYKIIKKKRLTNHGRDTKLDGSASYSHCRIGIEKGLAKQAKRLTLWHEIVHCILVQNSINEHDEHVVNAIAYGIMDVLQHNKELRKK
jgi:Zn-dependent peptidase ImmA (M78 family)